MVIDNGVGIDGAFIINEMVAINHKNNKSVSLEGSLPGKLIKIASAQDNPLRPATTVIKIDNSNSNATELIENFADQFTYYIDFFVNLNNFGQSKNDFAYLYSQ